MPQLKAISPLAKFILIATLFVGILCSIRVFLCDPTLGWDEAEQALFAQKLSAGYIAQPPLYYWLQHFFFQGLGINLMGMALLKYGLIFLCFYVYHQICQLYCQDKVLAWCATLSWLLIPNISIDLLPHRTHAIASLLSACLTWYWLVKPSQLAKPLWYAGFGLIIGIGFLSKSSYLLFFIVFFASALSIQELRAKLLQKQLLLSLIFAGLVTCPYWLWLIDNFAVGTSAAYKLSLTNKTLLNGELQLVKTALIYGIPALILCFMFSFGFEKPIASVQNKLLWRYHCLLLPLLSFIVFIANLHDFKTHWALPLFFLSPLLVINFITNYSSQRARKYLVFCIFAQLIILAAWAKHSYRLASFPLKQLVGEINKSKPPGQLTLVSSSQWLLGSLSVSFPSQQSFFMHRAFLNKPLPKGNLLLLWRGQKIPEWVDAIVPPSSGRQIKTLLKNQAVIGGYIYVANP